MRALSHWTLLLGLLLLGAMTPGVAAADGEDVENFRYAAWDLTYDLGLDAQDRAQAQVTERLAVEFPDIDQNRGIIRSLPLRYQSAPAAPENISVTDGKGTPVPFEVDDEDGFRNILVGDETFLHGPQTYVIAYTLSDVMHTTGSVDEFYWDLVPVERQQAIGRVTAQITLDAQLSAALTGSSACYRGTPDNSQDCTMTATNGQQAVFMLEERDLPGGHGLTAAIGVESGTVTQPPERHDNFVLDVVPLFLVGAALLLAGAAALAVVLMTRRHRRDTTVSNTAYGVPPQLNPLLARWLTGRAQSPVVATILDLAVRGVVRIEDDEASRGRQHKTKPTLRLMAPDLVQDPLERDLLAGMFPQLRAGETFAFPKHSKRFNAATQQVLRDSGRAVVDRGYQTQRRHRGAAIAGGAALVLLVPMIVLLVLGASRDNTLTTVFGVVLGLLTVTLSIVAMSKHRVLTPDGAALRRQLDRLRGVFTAAQTERLATMQSVASAPRRPASDTSEAPAPDAPEIIQLYDRLLPYAVLFGKQRDWSRVLAETYEHNHLPAPIWYPALWQHGTGGIQDSLTSMLSSVSAAAASSSPSAGSTGSGAVGGGGGGGAAGGR